MFDNEPLFRFGVAQIQCSYPLEGTVKMAISLIGLLMTLVIPLGLLAQQARVFTFRINSACCFSCSTGGGAVRVATGVATGCLSYRRIV